MAMDDNRHSPRLSHLYIRAWVRDRSRLEGGRA